MRAHFGHRVWLACSPALFFFTLANARAQGPTFSPGCPLPYAHIAPPTDPFVICGNCGVVSSSDPAAQKAAKAAESQAKNNLCGDMTSTTVVNFSILTQLQALPINKNNLGDRHILKQIFTVGGRKIGEGSVVRLLAFIKEAHISDCNGGEEVNCKQTGPEVNDIHIPLVDPAVPNSRNQDECASVTAEMIPHFRPAAWAQLDMKTPVNNPVRVTGQLFFDNSHTPCVKKAGGTFTAGSGPRRISLWEIHPVYQFDVCKNTDPQQCSVSNDSLWTPYDQWVTQPGSVIEATGQKDRHDCEDLHGKPSPPPKPTEPAQCATPSPSPSRGHGSRSRRHPPAPTPPPS